MMLTRILLLVMSVWAARAAVVRIEVKSRASHSGYERIDARVYFAVDPTLAVNRAVADLDRAPRNSDGKVEFSSDVFLLRPQKSNGTLLLDIPNRGGARAASAFDEAFLMQQGYTVAEVGWQFDLLDGANLLRLYVPEAQSVRGLVRAEILVDRRELRHSVAEPNHRPYKILNPDDPALTLTVRDRADSQRRTVPRGAWHIENADTVVMNEGFEPGRLYELVYTSENPPVAGLGMAAVRDLASYMKQGGEYADVKRAIGFGISQSGRFLRDFLYHGFNRDEADRRVFDGVWANVAGGGRGSFDQRFAQAARVSGAHSNTLYPIDLFPFTDLDETDSLTGATDGLLTHALRAEHRPKMFYSYSSHEYYGRSASLIHITPDAKHDAPLAPETRIYFFAGGAHGPAAFPPRMGNTQNAPNPNPYTLCFRALLSAINAWVTDGAAPPASVYPRIAAGEVVPLSAVKFPKIPGVALPTHLQLARREDYGPEFCTAGIATVEPPKLGAAFPALVPQVDADGNDLGGIRMPEIAVPLATYTGWNLRAPSIGAPGELASLQGSWIPFARTKAEREKTGDPRLSIEERYAGREAYLQGFEAAARKLVSAGFLLPADLPRLLERGAAEWDFAAKSPARNQ
jgi:Alpha/beta hydrolase domain